jgi:general secretion pathway protein G
MDERGHPRCSVRRREESGFTLIELLLVILILGSLAAVVIFALSGVGGQSAVAACNSDAATVQNAVGDYNAQTGGSPTVTLALLTNSSAHYLHNVPTNPNYVITIVGGVVMIAAPTTVTPVPYGTPNQCSNA